MANKSPAATLREAAALMRERAEAATPGEWHAFTCEHGDEWYVASKSHGQVTTGMHDEQCCGSATVMIERDGRDAAHIAAWSPLVALAVAGWLESVAYRDADDDDSGPEPADWNAALKIARTYLGQPDA